MIHRTLLRTLGAGLAVVLGTAGCSSAQMYAAGQQWQRNECRKLPPSEQDRCLKSNALSFEEYQREAAAARVPR